jgi:hypothetical protein
MRRRGNRTAYVSTRQIEPEKQITDATDAAAAQFFRNVVGPILKHGYDLHWHLASIQEIFTNQVYGQFYYDDPMEHEPDFEYASPGAQWIVLLNIRGVIVANRAWGIGKGPGDLVRHVVNTADVPFAEGLAIPARTWRANNGTEENHQAGHVRQPDEHAHRSEKQRDIGEHEPALRERRHGERRIEDAPGEHTLGTQTDSPADAGDE